jgi:PHD/YefM family antitoxin component YafN of YafNO toxin-antitoxin module
LLKQVQKNPVYITRHGKPVGVLISPDEYENLRQVRAYLHMMNLSRTLRDSGVTADELYQTSRQELEQGQ